MHLSIIILFIIFCIVYLCGFFDGYKRTSANVFEVLQTEKNLSVIEHLTQHKDRTKSYATPPQARTNFSRNVSSYIQDNVGKCSYEFPLLGRKTSVYSCSLFPQEVSGFVNKYGVQQQYVSRVDENTITVNQSVSVNTLTKALNRDGWYFRDLTNWGLDYANIVHHNSPFSFSIAQHIYTELVKHKEDTLLNRVQAALNFVQFIPYGRPNFDTAEWYYHELAIPAESFVLGYADCDSKSIFLATILMHLIPKQDIVLVECKVRSSDEKTNGAHMMVAVSGLGIVGEGFDHNQKRFILLETTAPVVMGKSDWAELNIHNIIPL